MADEDVINPPTRNVPFRGELLVVGPLRLQQVGPFITASRTIIARVAMMAGAVEAAERLPSAQSCSICSSRTGRRSPLPWLWRSTASRNGSLQERWTKWPICWRPLWD